MKELFDFDEDATQVGKPHLHQYFTPEWAAEELVGRYFPALGAKDLVIEPACGRGSFLKAVPPEAEAIGVEIDPDTAALARENTGRHVIVGDFASQYLPLPTASAVVGNPPFDMATFDKILRRSHQLLPDEARCGFILPAYALQTPSRLLRWQRHWSVSQTLLPRTIFQRSRLPLLFVLFEKGCGPRLLVGFTLYHEAHEIHGMPGWARQLLTYSAGQRKTWRAVVDVALRKIGGRGTLTEIYSAMQHRSDRASDNQWWKDKVRQVLQLHFKRVGPAEFALPNG